MDTIVALSSGALPAGVAVIRISGPKSRSVIEELVGYLPKPRHATLVHLKDRDGSVVDDGLCLWFPAPRSFTGEDAAELQVHGSRAVANRLIDLCLSEDGVRMAEPGEFARRAFTNGKIDLTEAEGLADLIEAETEAQRKVARYLASGGLRTLYDGWQDQLLNARALIEADIDFADEDDVPGSVADQVWNDIAALKLEIEQHLKGYNKAESIRNGFKISLIGKPNVGKSSLLNALAGSDRAIVSPEAGTTRDVVEVRLDLGGYLVLLSDTAGIRDNSGAIEKLGIERSLRAAQQADLVLHLSDSGDWSDFDASNLSNAIRVSTKADLANLERSAEFSVSVMDQESLTAFTGQLVKEINERLPQASAAAALRERYVVYLMETIAQLGKALTADLELEFRVEHLRSAAYQLGLITGQHDVEDVLGRIFSSFCIGK